MKEQVRRILIFTTIVGSGTVFIFLDIPLLLIIPLICGIGIILLILLGAVRVADLKTGFSSLLLRGKKVPAKNDLPQPQDAKGRPDPNKKPDAEQKTTAKKPLSLNLGSLFKKRAVKPEPPARESRIPQPAPMAQKKKGLLLHLGSLVSSVRTLGTILTTRKKADPDKLRKIDSLLDLAVSEKVDIPGSALSSAAGEDTGLPGAGGMMKGRGTSADTLSAPSRDEVDPFLSLSNDELEIGLLDDLDTDESKAGVSEPETGTHSPQPVPFAEDGSGIRIGDADIPIPPQEISSAADEILRANEPELADLPSLEGVDSVDENLGELDDISLDSVDIDDEAEEELKTPAPVSSGTAPAPEVTPAPDWVDTSVSEGIQGLKEPSDQSDMAAFAAASGGDDDMLSSLAGDMKNVKKKQDLSLLRDLKDFSAPGKTIESELNELYTALNTATERQKKLKPVSSRKSKAK